MNRTASTSAALTLAVILTATGSIRAQPGAHGPGPESDSVRIERTVARLTQELSLTKQQESQVRPVVERNLRAMRQGMQAHAGDPDSMRAVRIRQMEKMDREIESLLTDGQKEAFDRFRRERQQRRRDQNGPPPGSG